MGRTGPPCMVVTSPFELRPSNFALRTSPFDLPRSGDADGASDVENPYTFTARRLDLESALMQYRNRYYDPTLGRFTSRDPLGYEDALNLYLFVDGIPTSRIDPLGLECTNECDNEGKYRFEFIGPYECPLHGVTPGVLDGMIDSYGDFSSYMTAVDLAKIVGAAGMAAPGALQRLTAALQSHVESKVGQTAQAPSAHQLKQFAEHIQNQMLKQGLFQLCVDIKVFKCESECCGLFWAGRRLAWDFVEKIGHKCMPKQNAGQVQWYEKEKVGDHLPNWMDIMTDCLIDAREKARSKYPN